MNKFNVTSTTSTELSQEARYLKSIAKNAGFAGIGSIFTYILSPIIAVITTRALGPELYGIYNLATFWGNLLAAIATLGFAGTLIRFLPTYLGGRERAKAKGAFLYASKITFFFASILTIALFFYADFFCEKVINNADAAQYFRFYSISILFTAIYTIVIGSLTGLKNQKHVILAQSVGANIAKLGSLIIFLSIGFNIYAALASSIIRDIAILSLGLVFLLKCFPDIYRQSVKPIIEKKSLWKYSGVLFSTSLFSKYSFQQFDLLFLGLYRTPMEVGVYAVALRLQPLIYFPSYAIAQIFNPIIAELYAQNKTSEINKLYKTVTKWAATIGVYIWLLIIFFHQPILSVFGKDFRKASTALIILAIGYLIVNIFGGSGHVINMIGKPGINLTNSIITTVISLPLFMILIPHYGILGAAIAYTAGQLIINIIRFFQVYHFLKIHPFKLSLFKVFTAALMSIFVILFSFNFIENHTNYFWEILSFILLTLTYFLTLYMLKLDEDDKFILNMIRKKLIQFHIS